MLTAIRLRAISSIGDIMLDSVHQGRSGMTIKRVDRFGQHQLFVVCVRYVQDWPGLLRFATGCGGRSGWSPKVVIAASTVPAAGSKPCGSPMPPRRRHGRLHNVLAGGWGTESRHADLLDDYRWPWSRRSRPRDFGCLGACWLRPIRSACHDY